MNKSNDQIDFNFSRNLDIQKNLFLDFIDSFIADFSNKDLLFKKHLKIVMIELFYCWRESEEQFLSVSMSKRGYSSKSRYNPNKISSYTIKIINFLKDEKIIDFYPGFFDRKSGKSRLTRIRASKYLKNKFDKIIFKDFKINHPKREFLIIVNEDKKKLEYKDNFKTHELRELIVSYNKLLSKSLIDIPINNSGLVQRFDKKKIVISNSNSNANLIFFNEINDLPNIEGCWWNKLDFKSLFDYKENILVNNQLTGFVDLNYIFSSYLSNIFHTNKILNIKNIHKDFNIEKSNIIIQKALNLNNFQSLLKSVVIEKEIFFSDPNLSSENIKENLKEFLDKNNEVNSFFFKGLKINFLSFSKQIFLLLLKFTVPLNIPVFLIRDKIYFTSNFKDKIILFLSEIVIKKFNIEKSFIKSFDCNQYNFKPRGFFSKIMAPKNQLFSKRYLKRVSEFKLN